MTSSKPPSLRKSGLRVAFFSDALSERNGAGAYYHDLKEQLNERMGRIEMFQPVLGKHPLLQFALPMPGDPTQKILTPNIPRLVKQYNALQPHIVIAATPGPFGLLGLYLARKNKVGFLSAFHTHFEDLTRLYFNPVVFKIMNAYLIGINRALCKRSSTVLVNNTKLIPVVQELGAREVDVMGTPLSLKFLRQEAVPIPPKMKRVLFAGRLAPEKNVPLIIEAAKKLPDLEFVIVGDGPQRKQLEKDSAELTNVRLTGWLDRKALCLEIDNASLLLLPSKHETFGTVALESMVRGRPALVAEGAGIHDWSELKEGLVLLRESESLEEVMKNLKSWPEETWREKSAAARKAAEGLNAATIDQWVDLLERHAPVKAG